MQYLQRNVYQELKNHLGKPEISLILGPRQSGKTTLILRLKEELAGQTPTVYFNLDLIEDKTYFDTQHHLAERIASRVGDGKAVVFIDEVHRLTNAGLFIKGLYDMRLPYKYVITGSGSLELKANIIEPLTGRKALFYCLPLSFTELAANRLEVSLDQVSTSLEKDPFARKRLIEEYLQFGGYPRVVTSVTEEEKITVLREIFTSYLERDIQLLLGVKKNEQFSNLVKVLAQQTGNLLNRHELSSSLGIDARTLNHYLFLLEKTFVISLIKPYFRKARQELTKSPKVYFYDLGFLSLARGIFPNTNPWLTGGIFENACYLRLSELDLLEPIHYWRTRTGAEIDFIVTSPKDGQLITVEIKTNLPNRFTIGKNIRSFIAKYHPSTAIYYNLNQNRSANLGQVKIESVPYHQLLQL